MSTPRLTEGCTFHPFDNGSQKKEEYVVAAPGGRQYRVSALGRRVLERLDGTRSMDVVARELSRPDLVLTGTQLEPILKHYTALGLVESEDLAEPSHRASPAYPVRPTGFPFLLSFPLVPAPWVDGVSRLGGWLFARWAWVLGCLCILLAHVYLYREPPPGAFSIESYLWVILLAVASILVHELGHASALKRFGGQPGSIGFGLYLLMPVFFADVSQLWRFSRGRRVVVDLGGVYFQQLAYVVLVAAYALTGAEALRTTCHVIDFMVLMALNPIFRFDGYWVLVDYLALPNLQRLALRDLWMRLVSRGGRGRPVPGGLSGLRRVVFHGYSLVAGGFLVLVIWIAVRYLSSAAASLPLILPAAARATVDAALEGQMLLFLSRSIALFFVFAFPATALVGIGFYFVRIARWLRSGWHYWTERRARRDRRLEDAPDVSSSAPGRSDAALPLDGLPGGTHGPQRVR